MRGVSILMYHQVGRFRPMSTHRSTYCGYRRFAAQMALLKILGYPVLDFETLIACIRGETEVPGRAVVLTFDDGYENFYEYAFPVLKRHGFPATVYLLSGLLGRKAEWFRKEGRPAPPLMTRERIVQLMNEGICFGSHGISHKRLAEVAEDIMRREVFESKKDLERLFGRKVEHFCYPYGSYDAGCVRAVQEAGYRSAVSCVRGCAFPGDDPYQLARKAISYGDSLAGFLWKVHMKKSRKHPELPVRKP